MITSRSSSTLFDAAVARAVELCDDDIARLQRFFERNPDYFASVNGEGPGTDEARAELHFRIAGRLVPHLAHRRARR